MPGPCGFVFVDTVHEDCATTSASEGDAHASYTALTTETESTDWLPNQDRDQGELFDTDGITFVMDNSATCIICNDQTQFIGNLQYQQSEISTSQATGVSEYVGTIRLHLIDDSGQTFQYDIPGAVYDPNSPFNICGIPYLGKFFGKNDPIPSLDDDGTKITSSASRSHLVWDHGKHERHFSHGSRRLPELTLSTGYKYFSSFCTRVRRTYYDHVHFAFSSAHSILTSDASNMVTPSREKSDDCFQLGMSLLYKDGKGNNKAVVYEGASPDGRSHTVRLKDGSKVITPDSHLRLHDQPDLSNIPSTPLDYCKEIGVGLSREEVQELAYPRVLSPLQQELMSWHHRLYHLPFWRIFMYSEKGYLPKTLLECQSKPPLCVAC